MFRDYSSMTSVKFGLVKTYVNSPGKALKKVWLIINKSWITYDHWNVNVTARGELQQKTLQILNSNGSKLSKNWFIILSTKMFQCTRSVHVKWVKQEIVNLIFMDLSECWQVNSRNMFRDAGQHLGGVWNMRWDEMVTGQCADDVLTTDLQCCHCLCMPFALKYAMLQLLWP